MPTPIILIEQAGQPAGTPGSSRIDGVAAAEVTCTDTSGNTTGTYTWTVEGPSDLVVTLTGENTDTLKFTPPSPGTWLVFLQFDTLLSWAPDADGHKITAQGGLAVLHPNGTQEIAAGESDQFVNGYPAHQRPIYGLIDAMRPAVELGNEIATLTNPQSFTGNQAANPVVLTDGPTIAINATDSNYFKVSITADRVMGNPPDLTEGLTWIVAVTQATTGLHALTFDTYYDWGDGTTPDLTAHAAGVVTLITCVALSATKIRAVASLGA